MRPRIAGRTTARKSHLAPALMIAAGLLAVAVAAPALRALRDKEAARSADRTVALSVDFDDLRAFVPASDRRSAYAGLRDIPVPLMTVRDDLATSDESDLRAAGFHLLWKLRDGADSGAFAGRLKTGDGVTVTGEFALESPGIGEAVASAVRRQNGFLAIVEFAPMRPLLHLPSLLSDRLVRAHVIPSRETIHPRPALWTPRIVRAVRDRWVRLVSVRFSSGWTPEQNLSYARGIARRLETDGYLIGLPEPVRRWKPPFPGASWAALALAVLAPAAGIAAVGGAKFRGALVLYTVATAWSALAGLLVHGLVATPAAVAGVAAARGVKIQLLAPVLLSAAVLVEPSELAAFFRRRVTWGALTLAGLLAGGGLALYLMRSGNQPLLPVSDAERGFRDVLEAVLGARPRFKEFALGHPLLVAGLYVRERGRGFFRDGRAFLLLGAIGQISVVNTFVHAPAPVAESLLRTVNGWWIGGLIAIPLCHVIKRLPAFRT